jgi:hypothetical protein
MKGRDRSDRALDGVDVFNALRRRGERRGRRHRLRWGTRRSRKPVRFPGLGPKGVVGPDEIPLRSGGVDGIRSVRGAGALEGFVTASRGRRVGFVARPSSEKASFNRRERGGPSRSPDRVSTVLTPRLHGARTPCEARTDCRSLAPSRFVPPAYSRFLASRPLPSPPPHAGPSVLLLGYTAQEHPVKHARIAVPSRRVVSSRPRTVASSRRGPLTQDPLDDFLPPCSKSRLLRPRPCPGERPDARSNDLLGLQRDLLDRPGGGLLRVWPPRHRGREKEMEMRVKKSLRIGF